MTARKHRCIVTTMTAMQATALPATGQAIGPDVDSGAFLGRASAFIRSWTAPDAPRPMAWVLAAWRLAEHDLDRSTPGSDAWNDATDRFLAAGAEYRRLFELAAADAGPLRRIG